MASSVTTMTVNRTLGSCTAYLLSGPTKIVAKDMTDDDEVYIWEETGTEGDYQLVRDEKGNLVRLDKRQQSLILEGYGNHKFQLGPSTATDLVVGYAV